MSQKKTPYNHCSPHRDHQFQIQSLNDDSSESSDVRDHEIEDRVLEEDPHPNNSAVVKSLQHIPDVSQALEKTSQGQELVASQDAIPEQRKQQLLEKDNEKCMKTQPEEQCSNQVNEDASQNFDSILEGRKKKRKQIFQKIKRSSAEKPGLRRKSSQGGDNDAAIQSSKQQAILARVAFEKKKQNHSLLKAWNYRRLQQVQFHKKVCEYVVRTIEKYSKMSLQNLETFRSFFTQRCRQEQIHANSALPISRQFVKSNQIANNIYLASSTAYKSLIRNEKKQKQLALDFVAVVQQKILKEGFEEHFSSAHKNFLTLRSKLAMMREALTKIQQQCCQKLIKLQQLFTKSSESVLEEADADFYKAEVSFLTKCESEMSMAAKYGSLVCQFRHTAMQEETSRLKLLRRSLALYEKLNKALQQKCQNSSNLQKQVKLASQVIQQQQGGDSEDNQQIQNLYSLENLLEAQMVQALTSMLSAAHKQPKQQQILTQQLFNQYLAKLQFDQFDCHHLIMKKFRIEVLKEGKWIPGELSITVDKFVHIFASARLRTGIVVFGGQVYYEPELTLKIGHISLANKHQQEQLESDEELEIVISSKKQQTNLSKLTSLLKQAKKQQQTVRFETETELLQFQDYLSELST